MRPSYSSPSTSTKTSSLTLSVPRLLRPTIHPLTDVCSNGDIEDAPGLNSLQSFKVETDGGFIYVHADEQTVADSREPKAPSVEIQSSPKHANVLIIGGGAGAAHAVEALREEGFTGSVRVISKEPHLPCDRTKISKALISDPSKLLLRSQAFYDKLKAEFVLDTVRLAVSLRRSHTCTAI